MKMEASLKHCISQTDAQHIMQLYNLTSLYGVINNWNLQFAMNHDFCDTTFYIFPLLVRFSFNTFVICNSYDFIIVCHSS